jgi:glycine/D-amino acid oxidase-like deaminating enzyme
VDGRFEILIIGGGVAGLATAWQLARRGQRDVVLLEREPTLGTQSTGRNAAILRTLGSDPLITSVAQRSVAFLRRPPPGFTDVPLVDPCGLILMGDGVSADELRRWMAYAEPGTVEELTRERLHEIAPHLSDDWSFAVYIPDEGRMDIAALIDGFARGARGGGVEIRTRTAVSELLCSGKSVMGARLQDGEEVRARRTVIAAGGWAGPLGATAGSHVALRPTRRHLMVTAPERSVDVRLPVAWYLNHEFYCCPESGGLMLSACDQMDVDPDHCVVDPQMREHIAEKATRLLPAHADAGERNLWCGMRTLTDDGRFAVGPDPDVAGLFWVAGLGGHGMVCGPEVGRLAALLLCGETPQDEALRGMDPARLARRSS